MIEIKTYGKEIVGTVETLPDDQEDRGNPDIRKILIHRKNSDGNFECSTVKQIRHSIEDGDAVNGWVSMDSTRENHGYKSQATLENYI